VRARNRRRCARNCRGWCSSPRLTFRSGGERTRVKRPPLGWRCERRDCPPGIQPGQRRRGRWRLAAVSITVGIAVTAGVITFHRITGEHSGSVLDLPANLPPDLRLVATYDWGCGSQVCSRALVVTGEHGQQQAHILAELKSLLTVEHGWGVTEQGEACRDGGRNSVIDSTCIIVSPPDGGLVSIIVSEHSMW
jgi:hypothetical protein